MSFAPLNCAFSSTGLIIEKNENIVPQIVSKTSSCLLAVPDLWSWEVECRGLVEIAKKMVEIAKDKKNLLKFDEQCPAPLLLHISSCKLFSGLWMC